MRVSVANRIAVVGGAVAAVLLVLAAPLPSRT
jgi:hypothetical protein